MTRRIRGREEVLQDDGVIKSAWRYHQTKRDVRKIWVFVAPGYYAQWMNELQTCILDRNYFCRTDVSPAEIALTIVHEAAHARLDKLKIKYTEDVRERVERLCIKSEIAFAKRLPDGHKLVEAPQSRLRISESYWTNAQFQQRDLNALAEFGKKFWPARILYPILKRRNGKEECTAAIRRTETISQLSKSFAKN